MYPSSIFELVKDVLMSWQVIVVTIGIVIYLNIVFYAARYYRTPRFGSMVKKISFKRKKSADNPNSSGPETISGGRNSNDELGLDED